MIFKSPTRRRAEKMIEDICKQRAENVTKRNGITHKANEYSKLLLEDSRLNTEVKILRKLLKKAEQ